MRKLSPSSCKATSVSTWLSNHCKLCEWKEPRSSELCLSGLHPDSALASSQSSLFLSPGNAHLSSQACSAQVPAPLLMVITCVEMSECWHPLTLRMGRNQGAKLIITMRVYKSIIQIVQISGEDRWHCPRAPHNHVISLILKFLFTFPKMMLTLWYFIILKVIDTLTF